MSTVIAYYSATGNTLWAAEHFENAELIDICRVNEGTAVIPDDFERLGIFSPVYDSGLPLPVRVFIREHLGKRDNSSLKYIFSVFTRGAKGRTAERILERELEEAGLNLSYSASVVSPDYYLPLVRGKLSEEKNRTLMKEMEKELGRIKAETDEEKISLPPFSLTYRLIKKMSEKLTLPRKNTRLTVESTCIGCSLCTRVCPSANITIGNGKAVIGNDCISCYACYMVCPTESVKYIKDKGRCPLLVEKEKLTKR